MADGVVVVLGMTVVGDSVVVVGGDDGKPWFSKWMVMHLTSPRIPEDDVWKQYFSVPWVLF